MSRRRTDGGLAHKVTISSANAHRKKSAFGVWMEAQPIDPVELADQLGITASYVRALRDGVATPSAKLRIKIKARTDGAVPFDAW
jgi:hypothetical protein